MRVLALVLFAGLALPASAQAHAVVSAGGDTLLYWAGDASSQSSVEVVAGAETVRIRDTTIDGGMNPGGCDPGEVDRDGYIVEVICPRNADTRLRVDVGPRDDVVSVREDAGAAPLPTILLGGSGADRLRGGAGPDVLDGGPGADALEGGDGDDDVRARDGTLEVLGCGAGADRAYLDSADVPDGCEEVLFADPPPPPRTEPGPGEAPDTAPPEVDARAGRPQRVGKPAELVVKGWATEPAQLTALAAVKVGGQRLRLSSPQVRAEAPGERVRLVLSATAQVTRALRRALRRGRKLHAVVTVVAIDDAANSESLRLPRIRLRLERG